MSDKDDIYPPELNQLASVLTALCRKDDGICPLGVILEESCWCPLKALPCAVVLLDDWLAALRYRYSRESKEREDNE